VTAPLTFQFELNADETARAGEVITNLARSLRSQVMWVAVIVGPAVIVISLTGIDSTASLAYAIMMFIFGVGVILMPHTRRRQVRRRYASMPLVAGPQKYSLTTQGIEVSSAAGSTFLRWEAVLKAIESKEFLLLYLSNAQAIYVPKRVIDSESTLEAVRQLLRTHLGDRARGLWAIPSSTAGS
jgi:hypothetical protein